MTQNFRFRDAWNNAIWYALREVTGISSPYPMEVRLVPSIASETVLSVLLLTPDIAQRR
ncbi:MAG TPA: hypothetical protein ACHBX0_05865 [Arsenophonus sp.]